MSTRRAERGSPPHVLTDLHPDPSNVRVGRSHGTTVINGDRQPTRDGTRKSYRPISESLDVRTLRYGDVETPVARVLAHWRKSSHNID